MRIAAARKNRPGSSVERVVYIHIVADVAQLHGRHIRMEHVAPSQHVHARRRVRRRPKVMYQLLIPPLDLLKGDAAVGHILKANVALPLTVLASKKRGCPNEFPTKTFAYFIIYLKQKALSIVILQYVQKKIAFSENITPSNSQIQLPPHPGTAASSRRDMQQRTAFGSFHAVFCYDCAENMVNLTIGL